MAKACSAVLLTLLLLCGCSKETDSGQVRLVASIAATNGHLMIQNGDPVVWRDVTVTIDGHFKYHADWVARGGDSIPFSQFTGPGGKSYKPGILGIRSVSIHVPDFAGGKDGVFHW